MTIDLYWGRCGRIWCCRSLPGTVWKGMALKIFTREGMVGYVAEERYMRRCDREWVDISLLGKLW